MFEKVRRALGTPAADVRELPVQLGPELLKARPEFARVIAALRQRDYNSPGGTSEVYNAVHASAMPTLEKNVALSYWTSLCSGLGEPGADLLFYAHQPEPPLYANELTGDFWAQHPKKADRALHHYQRELALRPEAKDLRQKIVDLHHEKEDFGALAQLQADPVYDAHFTPESRLETAMRQKNWAAVWPPLIEMQKRNFSDRMPVILTSVAGLVWLILAWQMAQVEGVFSFRMWAPLIAIPLGAVSTLPVLFLDVYQSEAWGLKHTGLFFEDCLFFVGGVGLREELCKFLLFLPLVPILLWRGSRLEMIILAGCVGLGFAVEENVSYFRISDPTNAFCRFLTANFFHFAATGLVGLAFCDTVRNFRQQWWKFPVTFVVVAAAHGFYDAFIGVPLYVFMAIGMSCFILLSLAFFREVAGERGPATDQVFPAATLIVGLSILVATIIVCASIEYGLDFAMKALWSSSIPLAVFVYMFFVLFRDGLQEDEEINFTIEPL
jgi:RsiW-degrading membrane proteinase PrsW (M82 family)